MDLQRFKAACARIVAGSETGTGYLVAPDLVATCWHVVQDVGPGQSFPVTLHGEREPRSGQVLSQDRQRDCALLRIAPPVNTVGPLTLVAGCTECDAIPENDPDPWRLATRAERHLIDPAQDAAALSLAKRFYALAASRFGDKYGNIAVMRRQARRNLRYLRRSESEVDALLPVPGVAAFTGHMTHAPDRREPRFPPAKVAAVRAAVAKYVRSYRVGFGFASAARGGDLIFLEEVLAAGGWLHVFLPFPAADFKGTSVSYGWNARLDEVLRHERTTLKVLRQDLPPPAERPDAYAACNLAVRRAARAQADLMDQPPRLLAVWNGRPGETGGMCACCRR